jgi:aminoglycoside phosphotransferase (APT) family kinase protein
MRFDAKNINVELVRRLVADQFPQWSELPVREVVPNGWDNRTFRLGDQMSVRLPSAERYTHQVQKEHRWLPVLAPMLPLPIPAPLSIGEPAAGFPWEWSVNGWIEGETVTRDRISDMNQFAGSLAKFLNQMQKIDSSDGPVSGPGNFFRGGDLAVYDDETRRAIALLDGRLDGSLLSEVWDVALSSSWQGAPVWVHGDISQGNLLLKDGELVGVIDFGGSCVGDPACDLAIAWTLFDDESRDVFRDAIALDDATWARARGWTLWKALILFSGMSSTNAAEADHSRLTIDRILADR